MGMNAYKKYKSLSPLLKRERIHTNLWCWLFMSMTVIFYVIFQGWPIICSVWYSFLDWSGMTTSYDFVGLANYKELMTDELFWNAFKNSFKYTVLVVPIELVVSLLFAYILNSKKLACKAAYRTVLFLPVVTTAAIVGIVMTFVWGQTGAVNHVLMKLGILDRGINFLGNGKYAMKTVILISVWKDCGIYMIYWLAGLQSVPQDLYEAATVDGAGKARTFFQIVLPLIAPVAGIIAILCTINSLKVFDLVKTMTEGGPFYATDVIATYVYRMAFSSEIGMPRLGYSSSAALFFGIVVILVGVVLNTLKGILQKNRNI